MDFDYDNDEDGVEFRQYQLAYNGLRQLVVVNCPHPHTFLKAIIRGQDWQRIRSSYMLFIQIPWLPETVLTGAGGWLLRRGFKLAEGTKGAMNEALVDELVGR